MNGSGAHKKGSTYERNVAKILSKWTGEHYMRTLASGAGGTRAVDEIRMTGDIFAPIGSPNSFSYELKNHEGVKVHHVLMNSGEIPEFWEQATTDCKRVEKYGLSPMLIFHINRLSDFVLLPYTDYVYDSLTHKGLPCQKQRTSYTMSRTEKTYQYDTILTTLNSITQLPPLEVFAEYKDLDWDRLNQFKDESTSVDDVMKEVFD